MNGKHIETIKKGSFKLELRDNNGGGNILLLKESYSGNYIILHNKEDYTDLITGIVPLLDKIGE